MVQYWWIGALIIVPAVLAAVAIFVCRRRNTLGREAQLALARQDFRRQREWLEARFLTLAAASGKPRGLTWTDCEFADDVAFARDRHTDGLRALVAVTIHFEAIPDGDMEDNPNVHLPRAATTIFRLDGKEWVTDGRAVFNKNPAETIRHFQHELETVD